MKKSVLSVILVVGFGITLLPIACGGDGDGGSGACGSVCACVADNGGDSGECNQLCASINTQAECEAGLESEGFGVCSDRCSGFGNGGGEGEGEEGEGEEGEGEGGACTKECDYCYTDEGTCDASFNGDMKGCDCGPACPFSNDSDCG